MSQPVIKELQQLYDLWQNGLAGRDVYDTAVKEVLGRLLQDDSISLADKQQGLKAAKQYVSNQSLLLEAGKQLVQMRLEHLRNGGTGVNRQHRCTLGLSGLGTSKQADKQEPV